MRQRYLFALALLALVIAAGVGLNKFSSSSEPPPKSELGAEERPGSAELPGSSGDDKPDAPDPEADKKRVRYQELHQRLTRAKKAREEAAEDRPDDKAPQGRTDDPALPPLRAPGAGLQKEYIQEQMQEIVPLIKECYEVALSEDTTIGGKIVVEFVIIGEEEIGGLVESSQVVAEQSDVKSPPFLECVQETMYAIELDAPEGGGSTTIRYPFSFRSEPDEDKDDS